ncbi:M16 family metallopeptidase [Rhodoferax sp.]|uniref:M16 family metallopeptidase n=1 Tax=Rhodoferax sp. TaxID=50421 RepID=UPI00275F421F|nr:pitrilysin family protein [Rhodoferax sp.]
MRVSFKLVAAALAISLLAGAPPLALAQALPAGMSKVTSVEGIDEYKLANGLQVLLIQDDSKPTTTVNVTYRVGSKHENYGETGMAHLLEHLLFKGSPGHSTVWAEFTKRGLRANGTTWLDRTNYFASFSANEENLQWYLGWQADAMVNSFIARKDLDTEMTVVRNEMEMGENNAGRILFERVMSTAYQWHNYGKTTIGARTDVEGVNIERLQNFYRTYYRPANATVIVTGKFDPAKVRQWIATSFGPLQNPKTGLPPIYTLDPAQDGEKSITVRRVGGSPSLYALYHVPPGAHPDYAAISALNLILGDTPSGRLHQRIVEKQLAAGAFSFSQGLQDPGFTLLGLSLAPGQDLDKARQAMLDTIESLGTEPVTQPELDRAKLKYLTNWDLRFTNPEQVGVALSESIAQGDWRLFFLSRDKVRDLTLADVNRVASSYLVRDNRTLGSYIPTEKPVRAPAPATVDVAALVKDYKGDAAAAQTEAFDASPANIDQRTQTVTLANGMKLGLLPKGARGQVVSGSVNLHFGDEKSLFDQDAIGAATAVMLNKGTHTLSRQQIQDKFDQLKAQVGFHGGATGVSVGIKTTRDNLPAVIALVAEVLRNASFPANALEEYKRQMLAAIDEQRKDPQAVVQTELGRYGNPYPKGDVRYAATFDEMVESTKALTVEKLQAFHRKFYGAQFGQAAFVGDLDATATKAAVSASLGDWNAAASYTRVPNPLVAVKPDRFVFKTPDKQNAFMQVLQAVAVSDNDPDYPQLMLANFILGQGGSSRLWVRIREKGGLSYDVRSGVNWNNYEPNSGWSATAIFAPQNRAKVEAAFKEEVARMQRDGFEQKELDDAKQSLLNFRRLSRAQDGNLASGVASNLKLLRTFAISQKVDDQIAAATLEQVNAAMRRHLKPAMFVAGFGGDFKE